MKQRLSRITAIGPGSRQRHAHQLGHDVDYLRAVFEDAPEGVCILDCSLRLVVWNRAAAEITGYTAPESLGRRCRLMGDTLVLDPSCSANGPPVPDGRTAELPSVYGFCIKSKSGDGTYLNICTVVMPLRHSHLAFFIRMVRPIPDSPESVSCLECPIIRHAAPSAMGLLDGMRFPGLTPREREILRLLAEGKTAKPIAAVLSLAVPTVRTHIRNILQKLEVRSCLEAVVRFLRKGRGDPCFSPDSRRVSAAECTAESAKWGHPRSKR